MEKAFREGGVPADILALTQLSVWLMTLGIKMERTETYCTGRKLRPASGCLVASVGRKSVLSQLSTGIEILQYG